MTEPPGIEQGCEFCGCLPGDWTPDPADPKGRAYAHRVGRTYCDCTECGHTDADREQMRRGGFGARLMDEPVRDPFAEDEGDDQLL